MRTSTLQATVSKPAPTEEVYRLLKDQPNQALVAEILTSMPLVEVSKNSKKWYVKGKQVNKITGVVEQIKILL